MDRSDVESDCALVTFMVGNARSISSKTLFALVDVEMQIAGVSFAILGVQARNVPGGGTSIHLPTYRNTDGGWRPAIRLPDELHNSLGDAVLEFLVDEGIARRKYDAAATTGHHIRPSGRGRDAVSSGSVPALERPGRV